MAEVDDDQLREMAQHRGLKLVKSRRRKPGTGDYGKFGLTDAAGQALLGIGDDGLTASADEIQDYLRTSEQSTWKESAATTPDRPASAEKPRPPEPDDEDDDGPLRRRGKRAPADRPAGGRDESTPELTPQRYPAKGRPRPALRLVPKAEPAPEPPPAPEPAPDPVLRIRAATTDDADALAALLGQLSGFSLKGAEVANNLASACKAKAGMVVAELGEIVGCCGWAVVPTIHRGAIGRLTALVVDNAHRRRGIGTAMLGAAETALAKAGCHQVEAMSDITINNSHNFFRSLAFEQTSYRFVRTIGEQASGERVRDHTD
jgi:N-acetylglutamate synthase-like GNAT family acetyltransferase